MNNVSGISSNLASSQSVGVSASSGLATVAGSAQQLDGPFSTLNLTPAQQKQIQLILQNAQSQNLSPSQVQNQVDAVLTPAQQSQLQANLSDLKKSHHHRGGGASSSASDQTDEFGIPTNLPSTSNATTIGNIAAAYSARSQFQNDDTN
jgi:Spy/CpxP family protein refolding chaperone